MMKGGRASGDKGVAMSVRASGDEGSESDDEGLVMGVRASGDERESEE